MFPVEATEHGESRRLVLRPERSLRPFLHAPTSDPRLISMRVSDVKVARIRGAEFFGFDRPQTDGTTRFRWALGHEGVVTIGRGTGAVPLRLRTFAPGVATEPLEIRIGSPELDLLVTLPDHEWHEIAVPRDPREGTILRLTANRTWVPAETGNSDDRRELAFSVAHWWE